MSRLSTKQRQARKRGKQRLVKAFCPKCRKESFWVQVTNSGKGVNSSWMQVEYWFEGYGKCSECGYKGYYSDSSL